ncbi:hypothetical protein K5P26_12255 [Sphingopyxis sp. XHP0097]|uniref:TraB/GumN family protein n=1 Tax=Sphingopyxis jiangsuensis TaxID=2871171 RepID=A0ABS7MFV7_9SPHN|nr:MULTISPECIES: hypothetical protein [Sphingopyxis]MBY4637912.1 hypothetical protein [Sphingopyxis jiangsuensis]
MTSLDEKRNLSAMFRPRVAVALAILISPVPLHAAQSDCPDVLDYAEWQESRAQQWNFQSSALSIVGARHSRDPADGQFAEIDAAIEDFRPTLVFYEGPDRGMAATVSETIADFGESGFLRYLARERGVPARSLEPSPADQMKELQSRFPVHEILLFFTLREAVRLRDREGLSGAKLDARIGALLESMRSLAAAMGLDQSIGSVADLQQQSERLWPGRRWQDAEARWFSPTADDEETGGVVMGAINRADSSIRDRHFVRLLAEAMRAGERPFVVVGRNHVPMIAPALTCAVGMTAGER